MSRDLSHAHVDLILHFLVSIPNLPAKFEASSFNRSRDMEGVPKF